MSALTGSEIEVEDGVGRCAVAVVGGGLVGATLALALGRAGVSVTLVEATAPEAGAGPRDDWRPIALSQGSRRILATLGVWPAVDVRATPIRRIHVSDRGHFGFARLDARDHGVDALGYVVEAGDLASSLRDALAAEARVAVMRPAVVDALVLGADGARLAVHGPQGGGGGRSWLEAALLVASDGSRSSLRALAGLGTREHDYRQWAITASVTPMAPHANVAYERFTPQGPLALLPMSDSRCGVVWTVDASGAEALTGLDDGAFLRALGAAFGTRLGEFVAAGSRTGFPLRLVTTQEVVGRRVAIVGNAAHHLHPVAGQGLNLGLRDVAVLAEVVADALRTGRDPGATETLTRYAAWRRRDQRLVTRTTDALVRLFSNRLAPLAALRSAGLVAFDLAPAAKRRFARHAMGLEGRQPRLMRGLPV